MDDRVSDLARARVSDRDRGGPWNVVSAEAVHFVARLSSDDVPSDFRQFAFRSVVELDEFAD